MLAPNCYACGAAVSGLDKCAGCGAPQNEIARDAYRAVQRARSQLETWRVLAGGGILAAFVLGAALGFGAGQRQVPVQPSSYVETSLSREHVNDLFVRTLNDSFRAREVPFVITGWTPGTDGAVILEIAPPSRTNPIPLWQALDASERNALMAFISVAYARALAAGGFPPTEENGHPVITLQYRGVPSPLATRARDGRIYIYRSPYDDAAEQPR